jgi:ribonuclease HI
MCARILLLLWRAWHLRNDVVHNEGKARIDESAIFLTSYYDSSNREALPPPVNHKGKHCVADCTPRPVSTSYAPSIQWQPPPPNWTKINSDGSFSNLDQNGGTGVVIRDHRGCVLSAACTPLERCQDAEEAQALAALQGIRIASELGFQKVIFELDCASVVKAICSQVQDRSSNWATYEEAKRLLKAFDDHTVMLSGRGCNSAADTLAKHARTFGLHSQGLSLYPIIRDLVIKDMPLAFRF